MSGDRIEHGQITDSVIAFGKSAKSSTRESRGKTAGSRDAASMPKAARDALAYAERVRESGSRGKNITGRVVAHGQGSRASGYTSRGWESARGDDEQEPER